MAQTPHVWTFAYRRQYTVLLGNSAVLGQGGGHSRHQTAVSYSTWYILAYSQDSPQGGTRHQQAVEEEFACVVAKTSS